MEIELDLDLRGGQKHAWYALAAMVVILALVGLGYLGMPVTPYSDPGSPRLLGWADWRFIQAERAYQQELVVLRGYADQLSEAIETSPNPVAVQMLSTRILRQVADGDPALAAARAALAQAASDVLDWSTGIVPRDQALASLQLAIGLLQ